VALNTITLTEPLWKNQMIFMMFLHLKSRGFGKFIKNFKMGTAQYKEL
jgi:hypothetical protein